MTWPTGQEQIRRLITEGELEQVTADQSTAQRLLDDASRHLTTATAALATEDLAVGRRASAAESPRDLLQPLRGSIHRPT